MMSFRNDVGVITKNDMYDTMGLKGYNDLDYDSQRRFDAILHQFLSAQSTGARNEMRLVSVKQLEPTKFKLNFMRGDDRTYTTLNSRTYSWG